jgi:hypothetical protein
MVREGETRDASGLTQIEELILEAEVDHRRHINQIPSPVIRIDGVSLSSQAVCLLVVLLTIEILRLLNKRDRTERLCLQLHLILSREDWRLCLKWERDFG